MGYWKHKLEEEHKGYLEGKEDNIAMLGGFLDVKLYGQTICTVSIPIPNLIADSYRDSIAKWVENFEDFNGNNYKATVLSSKDGVEWRIDIIPREDDDLYSSDILNEITSNIEIIVNYI